jgi:hypothetical protein
MTPLKIRQASKTGDPGGRIWKSSAAETQKNFITIDDDVY